MGWEYGGNGYRPHPNPRRQGRNQLAGMITFAFSIQAISLWNFFYGIARGTEGESDGRGCLVTFVKQPPQIPPSLPLQWEECVAIARAFRIELFPLKKGDRGAWHYLSEYARKTVPND